MLPLATPEGAPAEDDRGAATGEEAGTAEPGKLACADATAEAEATGDAAGFTAAPLAGVTCRTFAGGPAENAGGTAGASPPMAGGGVTARGVAVPVGVEPMSDELTIVRDGASVGAVVGLGLAPDWANAPLANSTPAPTASATTVAAMGKSNRRLAAALDGLGSSETRQARGRFASLRDGGALMGTRQR
ncbi:MAG: hypothetical protein JO247_20615 [Chloroflexi bacterium]|nr:hypothetical protein [Chloroflexota bacterium]